MSLNWSAKNVENWEKVNTEENWPLIQNIIFYTMGIGMNSITTANYKEFRRRLLMLNAIDGYKELKESSDRYSEDFIKSLIGLSTNASTSTPTQFGKDLLRRIEYRVSDVMPR